MNAERIAALEARCLANAAKAREKAASLPTPTPVQPVYSQPAPPPPPRRTSEEVVQDMLVGLEKRDSALAATRYSDDEYREQFRNCVRYLARLGNPFTVDDVTDRIGLPPSSSQGAAGAYMNAAVRQAEVVAIGMTQSTRPGRNASRVTLWQSKATAPTR